MADAEKTLALKIITTYDASGAQQARGSMLGGAGGSRAAAAAGQSSTASAASTRAASSAAGNKATEDEAANRRAASSELRKMDRARRDHNSKITRLNELAFYAQAEHAKQIIKAEDDAKKANEAANKKTGAAAIKKIAEEQARHAANVQRLKELSFNAAAQGAKLDIKAEDDAKKAADAAYRKRAAADKKAYDERQKVSSQALRAGQEHPAVAGMRRHEAALKDNAEHQAKIDAANRRVGEIEFETARLNEAHAKQSHAQALRDNAQMKKDAEQARYGSAYANRGAGFTAADWSRARRERSAANQSAAYQRSNTSFFGGWSAGRRGQQLDPGLATPGAQAGGALGSLSKGIGGAYAKTSKFFHEIFRYYALFGSIFYGVSKVFQAFFSPVQKFKNLMEGLLNKFVGMVKALTEESAKIEGSRARLGVLAGGKGSKDILDWSMREAVGKPSTFDELMNGVRRSMTMGATIGAAKDLISPVAQDLSAATGEPVDKVTGAIHKGVYGRFASLQNLGFPKEFALQYGYRVRQPGVPQTNADWEANIKAILKMIEVRVGGTAEILNNTFESLASDMLDIWKNFALEWADSDFFKMVKSVMSSIRGSDKPGEESGFLGFRKKGGMKTWVSNVSSGLSALGEIVQTVMPMIPYAINWATEQIKAWGDNLRAAIGEEGGVEKVLTAWALKGLKIVEIFGKYVSALPTMFNAFTSLVLGVTGFALNIVKILDSGISALRGDKSYESRAKGYDTALQTISNTKDEINKSSLLGRAEQWGQGLSNWAVEQQNYLAGGGKIGRDSTYRYKQIGETQYPASRETGGIFQGMADQQKSIPSSWLNEMSGVSNRRRMLSAGYGADYESAVRGNYTLEAVQAEHQQVSDEIASMEDEVANAGEEATKEWYDQMEYKIKLYKEWLALYKQEMSLLEKLDRQKEAAANKAQRQQESAAKKAARLAERQNKWMGLGPGMVAASDDLREGLIGAAGGGMTASVGGGGWGGFGGGSGGGTVAVTSNYAEAKRSALAAAGVSPAAAASAGQSMYQRMFGAAGAQLAGPRMESPYSWNPENYAEMRIAKSEEELAAWYEARGGSYGGIGGSNVAAQREASFNKYNGTWKRQAAAFQQIGPKDYMRGFADFVGPGYGADPFAGRQSSIPFSFGLENGAIMPAQEGGGYSAGAGGGGGSTGGAAASQGPGDPGGGGSGIGSKAWWVAKLLAPFLNIPERFIAAEKEMQPGMENLGKNSWIGLKTFLGCLWDIFLTVGGGKIITGVIAKCLKMAKLDAAGLRLLSKMNSVWPWASKVWDGLGAASKAWVESKFPGVRAALSAFWAKFGGGGAAATTEEAAGAAVGRIGPGEQMLRGASRRPTGQSAGPVGAGQIGGLRPGYDPVAGHSVPASSRATGRIDWSEVRRQAPARRAANAFAAREDIIMRSGVRVGKRTPDNFWGSVESDGWQVGVPGRTGSGPTGRLPGVKAATDEIGMSPVSILSKRLKMHLAGKQRMDERFLDPGTSRDAFRKAFGSNPNANRILGTLPPLGIGAAGLGAMGSGGDESKLPAVGPQSALPGRTMGATNTAGGVMTTVSFMLPGQVLDERAGNKVMQASAAEDALLMGAVGDGNWV